ncbi:MAG TPA: cyclic nucleotide-binding domain-containing protein [Ignavibacteria bacterium]|jgi:CRP-like cAMP-binding protein
MFRKKETDHDHLLSVLSSCPVFEGLSNHELKEILKISHMRDYSADEKIFGEGTIGLCFYIIVKGNVVITGEKESSPVTLKEFGAGSYFSEVHLFSEIYHTVNCIAKEVTRAIVLAKPDFEYLVKIKPKLGNKLLLRFLDFFGEKLDELYKENRELKQNQHVLSA